MRASSLVRIAEQGSCRTVHCQGHPHADAEHGVSAPGASEPLASASQCGLPRRCARPYCRELRASASLQWLRVAQEVCGKGKERPAAEAETAPLASLVDALALQAGETADETGAAQEDAANDSVIYNDSLIIFRALCKLADKVRARQL